LTLPNGTVLTQVTRRSCLDRVGAIPPQSFQYSQTRVEPATDRRADCTGWVSYVWGTPYTGPGIYLHAYNTASFYTQHVIRQIAWADLLPGDVVGYCSPTSPGNGGHAAIWLSGDRRPDGRFRVSDHGSGWGPKLRDVAWDGRSDGWLNPAHLKPWRYVGIIESDNLPGEDMPAAEIWQTDGLVPAPTTRENQANEFWTAANVLHDADDAAREARDLGRDSAARLSRLETKLDQLLTQGGTGGATLAQVEELLNRTVSSLTVKPPPGP